MSKILCLIDSLGSGGAQRQMITLAKLLKEKDFEISFLIYHNDNFFIDDLRENTIPIEYCAPKNYLNRILKVWTCLELPTYLRQRVCKSTQLNLHYHICNEKYRKN